MNRERRLLYAVVILAPIVEGLMFAQWYQPDQPARQALLTQVHECQERLLPGLGRVPSRAPPQGRYLADYGPRSPQP
jgi:hypothetical protein